MAISGDPFRTPGFFENPVMPLLPGTAPGVIPDASMLKGGQPDYMKQVLADIMKSMMDVQNSFAKYLGAPGGDLTRVK